MAPKYILGNTISTVIPIKFLSDFLPSYFGFIDIENRINSGIETKKTVIATGGSVVYGKEAMEHYKNIGKVVYLKVSMDILTKRLNDVKQRGVVMKDGQSLVSLYNERTSLYEKYADYTIDEGTLTMEEVIADILSAIS